MAVGLEHNRYNVLAVADARVYHAMLDPKDGPWTYSGWKGRMIFGQDLEAPHSNGQGINETQKLWFRLVDDETGTTIWTFKFPEKLEYTEERPFFHVFKARVRVNFILSLRRLIPDCITRRYEDMVFCSMTMAKPQRSDRKLCSA